MGKAVDQSENRYRDRQAEGKCLTKLVALLSLSAGNSETACDGQAIGGADGPQPSEIDVDLKRLAIASGQPN